MQGRASRPSYSKPSYKPFYSKPSYSKGTSGGSKSNADPYRSYDDGYDDVYDEGDYDDERYEYDSDYADGVDDAIDENEDDW